MPARPNTGGATTGPNPMQEKQQANRQAAVGAKVRNNKMRDVARRRLMAMQQQKLHNQKAYGGKKPPPGPVNQ